MNAHLKDALRPCWGRLSRLAARSYAAGTELEDAVDACQRIARRGFASIVSYWNGDDDVPRTVADAGLAALGMVRRRGLDCYLSVKATALDFDDGLLGELLERGREPGIRIHFDSMWPEAAGRTFALIAGARAKAAAIGCTLPGRWPRSVRDADFGVERGLAVRVVKGQWVDPDDPGLEPRAGFLAVIDRLAGRARHVAVATHDVPLACEALRRLQAAQTSCELELLLGLPVARAARAARDLGVPVRLYVPYGRAWVPYCVSQVRRNPRMLWWVVRDVVFGRSLSMP